MSKFLNSLLVRLLLIVLGSAVAIVLLTDVIYPKVIELSTNALAQRLATTTVKYFALGNSSAQALPGQEHKRAEHLRETVNDNFLSWLYISGSSGSPLDVDGSWAPSLKQYANQSRMVRWNQRQFYEAVAKISPERYLHIGVYCPPGIISSLTAPISPFVDPGVAAFWSVVIISLFLLVCVYIFAAMPLRELRENLDSLTEQESHKAGKSNAGKIAPKAFGSVSEIDDIVAGFGAVRSQHKVQLDQIRLHFEEDRENLIKQYEEEKATLQAIIDAYRQFEANRQMVDALADGVESLETIEQVCQKLLEGTLQYKQEEIAAGAYFSIHKDGTHQLDYICGFDENAQRELKRIDHNKACQLVTIEGHAFVLDQESGVNFGFEKLMRARHLSGIVMIPAKLLGRTVGIFTFFFRQPAGAQTIEESTTFLKDMVEAGSEKLYRLILRGEEDDAARIDAFTQLPKRQALTEIAPLLLRAASANPEERQLSFLMIAGDHLKSINDIYGYQAGEEMIKELSQTIKEIVPLDDWSRPIAGGNYLFRLSGDEFLLLMGNCHFEKAFALGNTINTAVNERRGWPGGIARWTVSIGAATFPFDGTCLDELWDRAKIALRYVQDELGHNHVIQAHQVPKSYISRRRPKVETGGFDSFNAGELLHSIAAAEKTGILTVKSKDGSEFWLLMQQGLPLQARLARKAGDVLAGNQATVDFWATFEDGSYNFEEIATIGPNVPLPKIDDVYNVSWPTDKIFAEGSLAQEKYKAAKKVTGGAAVLLGPVQEEEFIEHWKDLEKLDSPPTEEELKVMAQLAIAVQGPSNLGEVLDHLDSVPKWLKWRSSALMLEQGLMSVIKKAGAETNNANNGSPKNTEQAKSDAAEEREPALVISGQHPAVNKSED